MKLPRVGGRVSISEVLVFQQGVMSQFVIISVFLVQITPNKAKNQCRNMDRGLSWSSIGQCWLNTMKKQIDISTSANHARGMKVIRGHR
jgi:hypothetical protein